MNNLLRIYRVLAYVVGTGLVILVLIGVPLRYLAHVSAVVAVVGPLHGFLFIAYLLSALTIAMRYRLPVLMTVLVLVAGTVPFASFVAEHFVTQRVRAADAARQTLDSDPALIEPGPAGVLPTS